MSKAKEMTSLVIKVNSIEETIPVEMNTWYCIRALYNDGKLDVKVVKI